jgi:REP element-mobilizing transposase RayT
MDKVKQFCNCIRQRSDEHKKAIQRTADLPGIMASIIRQELDSMVLVIYLLAISDLNERKRLIQQTINGNKWIIKTIKRKERHITDRELVELANQLQGWTKSVYKFGCAFIHLSNSHAYNSKNPFESLPDTEKNDILSHMRYYHSRPSTDYPSFEELATYFPMIFEKIASNLECYLKKIESNQTLDDFEKSMNEKEKTEKAGSTGFPACAQKDELSINRRNLPHWQLSNSTYFITFRLKSGIINDDEKGIVLDIIKHFHTIRYWVTAIVVMPDHIHLMLKPVVSESKAEFSLSKILQGIKGFSAREINKARGSKGSLWQEESFDRIVRDHDEYLEKWNYIRNNPVKTGLCQSPEGYPFLWEPGEPIEEC